MLATQASVTVAIVCYVYRPLHVIVFFACISFCLSVYLCTLLPYLVNKDVHRGQLSCRAMSNYVRNLVVNMVLKSDNYSSTYNQ